MPSVLFVCTANRFRSPVASALFLRCLQKDGHAQDWRVSSAGTWAEPGLPVFPSAKWMTDNLGLDLQAHKAVRIDRELLAQYDLILVMENNHRESLLIEFPEIKGRLFLLTEAASGIAYDIPDPDILQGDTFLGLAQELSSLIDKGFQKICFLAHQKQRQK
jgi:protein-tyrosine-phosphatase